MRFCNAYCYTHNNYWMSMLHAMILNEFWFLHIPRREWVFTRIINCWILKEKPIFACVDNEHEIIFWKRLNIWNWFLHVLIMNTRDIFLHVADLQFARTMNDFRIVSEYFFVDWICRMFSFFPRDFKKCQMYLNFRWGVLIIFYIFYSQASAQTDEMSDIFVW